MALSNLFKTPKRKAEEARLAAEAQAKLEAEKALKKAQAKERRETKKAQEAKKVIDADSPKGRATAAGNPWVQVLNVELDPDNPGAGAFELDWNDVFVARLIKSGYQGKTDQDIVDNWFQDVCRHVVMESYEQEQADPDKRNQTIQRKDIGGGKAEFS